ncbi:zinc finger BED domain-containing protein RICESLEEPER 2 [Tanacetum coccineum]
MASNPENVRLSVLAKLQEALDEEDILADQILTMMHRYADRFTNRRVEINNLMVLQDHPLVDYEKEEMILLILEHLNLLLTEIVTLYSDEGTPGLSDMRVAQDDLPTEMSGREQYQVNATMVACNALYLDGLVIVGGVTSNSDAAQLAETFAETKCATKVVGVPGTLNGDLKNYSLYFVQVNSQLISNVCTNALFAEKVQRDEPASIVTPKRVSPWEIETFVVTAHMSTLNAIAVEAYKKYILVSLIHLRQFSATFPKYTSAAAQRNLKSFATDGEIYATINQKDGMVRFLEDPEQYKTSGMIEHIDSSIKRIMKLSKKLTTMDEKMACDPVYLSRLKKSSWQCFLKDKVGNKLSGGEDELKKYLKEPCLELEDDEDFDVLTWWKINSPRFSIVSRMAKDILCIQVSTVASESAFSASGRVLNPYRNSLAPNIVEALVCTQDWIRTSSRNITMDTLEDLMKDDELAKAVESVGKDQMGNDEYSLVHTNAKTFGLKFSIWDSCAFAAAVYIQVPRIE